MNVNAEKVCNAETYSKASSLLALISSFQSNVGLVASRNVLEKTLPITQLLQERAIDVVDGIHLIDSLTILTLSVRNQVDHYHNKWYD